MEWTPHPGPQEFALAVDGIFELLYGGARGGGKTEALLIWLVESNYIMNPAYRSLVLRRNFDDLSNFIDRAEKFYFALGAKKAGRPPVFTFPSGAKITCNHLNSPDAYTKYQGHEYQKIGFEELTHIPDEKRYLNVLSSCRSTIKELPARVFATTNPGGIGHNWVKKRWKIGVHHPNVAYRMEDSRLRMFVPAKATDNPTLMVNDPSYIHYLGSLPEPYRSAWRDGNWNILDGQVFMIEPCHIVKPMPVPKYATLLMTMDWGFGAPFSVGWWWEDDAGRLYRFSELYGKKSDDEPNEGVRQPPSVVAQRILEREKELGLSARHNEIIRLAGPDCWNRQPDNKGGGQLESPATIFAQYGLYLRKGDPSRKLKKLQFHERLHVKRDAAGKVVETPMLQVYDTCTDFLRTISMLLPDSNDPEDIDSDMEDHIYDEACHAMMRKRIARSAVGDERPQVRAAQGKAFNPDEGAV